MFRRPMMSILKRSFHVVDLDKLDASCLKLVSLSRQVAAELTLLSVLAPLCVSDVAVKFCEEIFATDASFSKGAMVGCHVGSEISEIVWKCCRSKGGYSKLLTPTQSILARSLDLEEEDPVLPEPARRPLAYRFDFLEIFAGAATVTKHVADLGFSVGCPIDISFDRELDMTKGHVLEWVLHLI